MGTRTPSTSMIARHHRALLLLGWGSLLLLAFFALLPVLETALDLHRTRGSWAASIFYVVGALYRPFMVGVLLGSVRLVLGARRARGLERAVASGVAPLSLAGVLYALYACVYVDLRALWILAMPVAFVVDVTTIWLLGVGLVRAWSAPATRSRRLGAGAAAGAVLLFAWQVDAIGEHAYFLRHRTAYERALASLRRDPSVVEDESLESLRCHVDAGPPLRVAFQWPGGVTDNWWGVVWDPTGEVLRIDDLALDGTRRFDASSMAVELLFGGCMTHARHLRGPWYVCWFT